MSHLITLFSDYYRFITSNTVILSDRFNRTDNTSSVGNTETGQTWIQSVFSGTTTWGIQTNRAYCSTNTSAGYLVTDSGVYDAFSAQVNITYGSSDALVIRYTNTQNYVMIRLQSTGLDLCQVVSNTITVISSYAFTPTVGQTYAVKAVVDGDFICGYLDNTVRVFGLITANHSSTMVGVRQANASTAGRFDDFVVNKVTFRSNLAYDNFTRIDNSSSLGSLPSSQTWAITAGTWGIANNSAKIIAAGAGIDRALITTQANMTIRTRFTSAISNQRISFRHSDTSNEWIFGVVNGSMFHRLAKRVANSTTIVGTTGVSFVAGDVAKISTYGDLILCYVNGVLVYVASDTFNNTATKVGLCGESSTNATFDDFKVDVSNIIIGDTFTKSDSTTTVGNSDTGHTWTASSGTWGIRTGKAYSVTDTNGDILSTDIGRSTNYTVSASVTGDFNTNFRYASLVLYYVNPSNYIYCRIDSNATEIVKYESGSNTVLATASISATNGSTYNLKALVYNNVIYFYVDNVFKTSYNTGNLTTAQQSLYLGSTKVGLRLSKSGAPASNCDIDNFVVTQNV